MTIFTCDLELNYRHTQLKWDKNKTNFFFLTVHTHNSENTHREHTPGAVGSHLCCGDQGEVGGSVSCSRALQSWY